MIPAYYDLCISKWRLEDLSNVIDQFETLLKEDVDKEVLVVGQTYKEIVLRTSCKAIRTFREIVVLCACGFPEGAMALSRGMYEHFSILYYLSRHKESDRFQQMLEDYYLDERVQWDKVLGQEVSYTSNEAELQNDSFGKPKTREKSHRRANRSYWWSGKNSFDEIVRDNLSHTDNDFKKFQQELHLLYKWACVLLHHNCLGNSIKFGTEPDFYGIDNRPTVEDIGIPLSFATMSFIYIAGACSEQFNADYFDINRKLNDLAIFYHRSWKSNSLHAETGDNV